MLEADEAMPAECGKVFVLDRLKVNWPRYGCDGNNLVKKAVILSPKALFSFPSNEKVRSMVLWLSISPFGLYSRIISVLEWSKVKLMDGFCGN